jgi:hypothetical protein
MEHILGIRGHSLHSKLLCILGLVKVGLFKVCQIYEKNYKHLQYHIHIISNYV